MRILTKQEIDEFFSEYPKSPEDYVQYDGRGLFFAHSEADCVDLEYPTKLERMSFLARFLATVGYESQHFAGALLWITEWGVWSSDDEASGYHIVEAMHRAAGQPLSFEIGRGHQFRSDELVDATGMLLQPMIFGWDAYYLPRWSYGTDDLFIHVSHDSLVTIVTRTSEFHQRIFKLLQELDLNPQQGHRKANFCHSV